MILITSKNFGVYTTMSQRMKEWCRAQRGFHGSMAGYLRFLINLDMRGLISAPDKVIHIHSDMPPVYDEKGAVMEELREVLKDHLIE